MQLPMGERDVNGHYFAAFTLNFIPWRLGGKGVRKNLFISAKHNRGSNKRNEREREKKCFHFKGFF